MIDPPEIGLRISSAFVFLPQSLVVDLHHADPDLVVPVCSFLHHLGEQQAECSLVDAGVVGHALNTETEGAESTGRSAVTAETDIDFIC